MIGGKKSKQSNDCSFRLMKKTNVSLLFDSVFPLILWNHVIGAQVMCAANLPILSHTKRHN